jgi:hypothetical protein
LSSIITPARALQDDRLVLAQHFASGDAKQNTVPDLAGGTGDCDAYG